MAHPLAGQVATAASLTDIAALLAVYHHSPDVSDPAQRVAFGTSGHRGSAFGGSFNEAHILAIAQAVAEYRAEAGIGGLEYSSWVGLFGPAGMPQAVVDKLSKAVAVALANPETRAKIQASGNEVAGGSPAELSAFLAEEISKWSKTIAAAGLQPE